MHRAWYGFFNSQLKQVKGTANATDTPRLLPGTTFLMALVGTGHLKGTANTADASCLNCLSSFGRLVGPSVSHTSPPPKKNSEFILPFYYRSTCFSCRSSPAVAASNGKIYAIGGDQISEVNFYRARYEELPNIMYFWSEPSLLITLSVCLSIWALLCL